MTDLLGSTLQGTEGEVAEEGEAAHAGCGHGRHGWAGPQAGGCPVEFCILPSEAVQ